MPELVTRLASMFTSFKPIRAKVLFNKDIPVESRLNIVRGFLIAKGMFQFSTFRELNITEAKKVHSSIMSIYCAMLGADRPHVEHINDDTIVCKLEVLTPLGMLSYMRVHLFVRMLVRPPVQLWHLLVNVFSAQRSWLSTINNELNRVAASCDLFNELRASHLQDWAVYIINNPSKFLTKYDQALRVPVINCTLFWIPDSPFSIAAVESVPDQFSCDNCAAVYPTRQGLVWHRFRAHNCRVPLKSLITSTHCISCLNEYTTRTRLYKHLTGPGDRCIRTYFETQIPIAQAELDALEAAERAAVRALARSGYRETHSACTPTRLKGPLIEAASNNGVSFEFGLATGNKRLEVV